MLPEHENRKARKLAESKGIPITLATNLFSGERVMLDGDLLEGVQGWIVKVGEEVYEVTSVFYPSTYDRKKSGSG